MDKINPPRREREQPRLRGCGDPDCTMCNPHTAGQEFGKPTGIEPLRDPFRDGSPRDFMRRAAAEMRRAEERAARNEGLMPQFVMQSDAISATSSRSSAPQPSEEVARYVVQTSHTVRWDSVFGNEEAKSQLISAVEGARTYASLYAHYNMKPPRGVLLYGPPGCGKTMFAKAAAARLSELYGGESIMISMSAAALQSPFVGVTENRIKEIFDYARAYMRYHNRPLPVFIDEADALFPSRTGRPQPQWVESQITAFLEAVDGVEECGAFVILATNRPEVLDSAVTRDGRIDRKIRINRPDHAVTLAMLEESVASLPWAERPDDVAYLITEYLFAEHHILDTLHHVLLGTDGKEKHLSTDHEWPFLLQHIVSGAMVAGLPERAKQIAFEEDRKRNTITGVRLEHFHQAIDQLLRENKDIDHSYAREEFVEGLRPYLDNQQAAFKKRFEA